MTVDLRRMEIIRQHKRWCDRYIVLSVGIILMIFAGAVVGMNKLHVAPTERTGIYVMLATIILAAIVWNAVGMAVAEIHAILEGRRNS